MLLLKKATSLIWDEWAKNSFDTLKKSLALAPMLTPPDYSCDFLLYVAASQETIGMVLVQADDELSGHIIYYLIQNLIDVEIIYSHIDKVSLATIHSV